MLNNKGWKNEDLSYIHKQQLIDCTSYLKERGIFRKLMEGLKDKYISLGRIGGSVKLQSLKEDEKSDLEGFFGQSFHNQKGLTISAKKMQKALSSSRFDKVDLEELIKAYFGSHLETKEDKKKRKQKEIMNFFNPYLDEYKNTFSGEWLKEAYYQKGNEYRYLIQKYRQSPKALSICLDHVLIAGNILPVFNNQKERLAVFATKVSKDPHYFDEGTVGNRLLTYIIEYYIEEKESDFTRVAEQGGRYTAEQKNELFYHGGILKDDLSNYTTAYGIRCGRKDLIGDTLIYHKGIDGYYQEEEPVQISLLTLGEISHIWSNDKEVYIFENPTVFLEVCSNLPNKKAVVCTNGQLRLASFVLLDLFYKSGYKMYYGGDFDPEGLQIADKLKIRYKDQLILWKYSEENYEKSMSDVPISEQRLKKLKSVRSPELYLIKKALETYKRAGYQEKIIGKYLEDMMS